MFKLDFRVSESKKKINLKDPILLIGSCFSEEIGSKLSNSKFNVLSNPFGTIYNPYSIFKLLSDEINKDDIVESQGVYFHWDTHGIVSALSEEQLKKSLNQRRKKTQSFIRRAKWLIITPGTSIVYEMDENRVVANCHKVPSKNFKKKFLQQEEIISGFSKLLDYLHNINSELNIIFTISPVRHIRDGLIDNNRSKAILIDVIHALASGFNNVDYFPSYEILIDELRDYRFYAEDMIHPSQQAVDYIWNKFSECYLDQETLLFTQEWKNLKSAINHKAFHPSSVNHQKFLKNTLIKLKKMNEKVDMSVEIEQLKSQIA